VGVSCVACVCLCLTSALCLSAPMLLLSVSPVPLCHTLLVAPRASASYFWRHSVGCCGFCVAWLLFFMVLGLGMPVPAAGLPGSSQPPLLGSSAMGMPRHMLVIFTFGATLSVVGVAWVMVSVVPARSLACWLVG
jgi:hypothetical protein